MTAPPSIVRVALVFLGTLALVGIDCRRSSPGCPNGAACDGFEAGGAPHARLCINACLPRPEPSIVESDRAACALDPCDEAARASSVPFPYQGVFACPAGYRCDRDDAVDGALPLELGVCREARSGVFEACDSMPDPRFPDDAVRQDCEDGTFCAGPTSASVSALRDLTGQVYATGACMLPVPEGGLCDSNLADPEHIDWESSAVGERPCEQGTFCLRPDPIFGGGGTERRCIRGCGGPDGNIPSDDYCACQTSYCVDTGTRIIDPALGDIGGAFCAPCLSNGEECDGVFECCDTASTCEEERPVFSGQAAYAGCCWADGTSCDPSAAGQGCCRGSACIGQGSVGSCEQCGVEGDEATTANGCCEGLTAVALDGKAVCTRCGGGCSPEYLVTRDPVASHVVIPNTRVPWTRVEPHPAGGRLEEGSTTRVDYRLAESHRAYLFEGKLDNGITQGQYVALPPAVSAVTESLPSGEWNSVRVYDQGQCSVRFSYDQLVTVLVVQTLGALLESGVGDITDVRHLSTTLGPVLKSTPREPLVSPRGLSDVEDGLRVHTRLRFDSGLPVCGYANLDVQLTIQPRLDIGFNTTNVTRAADDITRTVACATDHSDREYNCRLLYPGAPGGLPYTVGDIGGGTAQNTFAFREPDRAWDDADLEQVECRAFRTEYACLQPVGDNYISSFIYEYFERPVDYVANSRDILVGISDLAVDVEDCAIGDAFGETPIAEEIRNQIGGVGEALSQVLADALGDSAENDFGVDPSTIPGCGSDADCRRSSFLGNRRHSCVAGRCDGFRLEPRRLNVRPEGIEIVLAEDSRDPQAALLDGATFSGVSICGGDRYDSSEVNTEGEIQSDILELAEPIPSLLGPICDADEFDCDDVCPSVGAPCDFAFLAGRSFPPGSSCNFGQCCPTASVCAGACRNLERDLDHCGVCGNSCALGERCEEGSCIVP